MQYLETAKHLKEIVAIALEDILGEYLLPHGQKIKAIAINPSMANLVFPPPGTSIEGLECHIYYPEIKGRSVIGGANWKLEWLIYFKQWDTKKTTLLAAENFVASCPYSVTNIFRNPPNANINQPEVCRIKVSTYSTIYN